MKQVTRDVILDLLPLYLADEVSADTRLLVETYLEQDPTLARIAEQSNLTLTDDVPIPITKETEMETYKETKRHMTLRTIIIASIIAFALLVLILLALFAFGALFFFSVG